jgi:hypothetical protein
MSRLLFQSGLLAAIVIVNTAWEADAGDPIGTIDPRLILEEFDVAKDGEPLLLPVRFQDKTYLFLVDTGSAYTVYDVSLRPLFGKPIKIMEVPTAGSNMSLEFFTSPRASVGKLSIQTSVPVAALDFTMWRQVSGSGIYGVLGMDFLGRQIVHIDQDQGKVLFLRPGGTYPGHRVGISYSPGDSPEMELVLCHTIILG